MTKEFSKNQQSMLLREKQGWKDMVKEDGGYLFMHQNIQNHMQEKKLIIHTEDPPLKSKFCSITPSPVSIFLISSPRLIYILSMHNLLFMLFIFDYHVDIGIRIKY